VDTADSAMAPAAGAWLVAAETQIADRYRLVERVGANQSGQVEFWLARDSVLARYVGATLVAGSEDAERSQWASSMVTALLQWGQFSYQGCPRILDVVGVGQGTHRQGLPDRVSFVVVTDWAPGPTLQNYLISLRRQGGLSGGFDGETPTPTGPVEPALALRMVAPLAAAADAAHGHGLRLGCYRPDLLYVTQGDTRRAHVHLRFLLPDPARASGDDVRGLGAVLYALLTGNWPLVQASAGTGAVAGGAGASDASLAAPHVLNAGVPREVSKLTMGALGPAGAGGTVETAATLHQAITALLGEELCAGPGAGDEGPSQPVALRAVAGGEWAARPGSATGDLPSPTVAVRPESASEGRARVVGACAVAALSALGALGVGLWHQGRHQIGPPPPSLPAPPGAIAGALSGTATVVSASVYDPTGQPDNPTQVWRALGADPKAGWSTDTYLQPFPALKPGVGIMVGFAGPVQLTSLRITSPSSGSELEVRSAVSPTSPLAETAVMASTRLQAGETAVSLADSQPVTYVLVWITKLGGGGDDNLTEISNLRFTRATD